MDSDLSGPLTRGYRSKTQCLELITALDVHKTDVLKFRSENADKIVNICFISSYSWNVVGAFLI